MKLPGYPILGKDPKVWARDVVNFLRPFANIRGGPGVMVRHTANGVTIALTESPKKTIQSTTSQTECTLGAIIDVDDATFTKAISGGVVYCGDKNFNVAWKGIDLTATSTTLVYLTLSGIDPATDDDEEIFLPGVITSSSTPAWGSTSYSGTESYPVNTNPTSPTGTGTIIIPIGILTIADGAASLDPVACGNVTVAHCAGILSHSRG